MPSGINGMGAAAAVPVPSPMMLVMPTAAAVGIRKSLLCCPLSFVALARVRFESRFLDIAWKQREFPDPDTSVRSKATDPLSALSARPHRASGIPFAAGAASPASSPRCCNARACRASPEPPMPRGNNSYRNSRGRTRDSGKRARPSRERGAAVFSLSLSLSPPAQLLEKRWNRGQRNKKNVRHAPTRMLL